MERAPPGLAGLFRAADDYRQGAGGPLSETAGMGVGVLICYESLYPELARRDRRLGAELLLNLTNDSWFGGEAGVPASAALDQHPAHLALRAIENRVGVGRAAATGLSLLVDPVGRVRAATPAGPAALLVGDPGTTDVVTLYARLGDWVGGGSAALAALLALAALARGRRPSSLDPSASLH